MVMKRYFDKEKFNKAVATMTEELGLIENTYEEMMKEMSKKQLEVDKKAKEFTGSFTFDTTHHPSQPLLDMINNAKKEKLMFPRTELGPAPSGCPDCARHRPDADVIRFQLDAKEIIDYKVKFVKGFAIFTITIDDNELQRSANMMSPMLHPKTIDDYVECDSMQVSNGHDSTEIEIRKVRKKF
jgi:hypothetical protein